MATTFPTSLDNYTGSETLSGAGHAQNHNAIEAKLGTGSSTPVASTVLRGTGTGTSSWAQVVLTTDVTGTLPVANGGTGVTSSTGTTAVVLSNSPTLVTPTLGVASATSINKVAITAPATSATLTIANGKTLTVSNTLTLAGTDSTTMTFPGTSDTVAGLGTAQTFTATNTHKQIAFTVNAITATTNAATVPITHRIHNVTNNSAATLTITMTTTSAVDGQLSEVRIFDFSAVAQTVTWVNTENSTVTAPTTSNGSTTLPLSVLFQYNSATSKWRCIASA